LSSSRGGVQGEGVGLWISTGLQALAVPRRGPDISWKGRERCLKKSPLYLAERVEMLILIIHSMENYRTWLDKALCLSSQPLSSTAWRLSPEKTIEGEALTPGGEL
jgi:hypothetical protein